ncbi:RAB6-interacting golgin [Erpetoichthys calabaricus]|uniref:RAB6-interacting golgin n=1 Tax=Erpetoichthys calabaricus TaxID=27687 RepID=A0A8C4SM64_ERPCA|nr:RAB6-interacting golgin [Erpetoichthys calabaricus]
MAGWAGFSEEELRKIQQKDNFVPVSGRGRRPPPANRNRQQLQRDRALQQIIPKDGDSNILPEQQLFKEKRQPSFRAAPAPSPVQTKEVQKIECQNHEIESVGHSKAPGLPLEKPTEIYLPGEELDQQQVELKEKTRLELLQQEQRLMEEKNKRKKALLAKAIAERSKQTQAETVKLKRIQKELQTLDDLVSNDIGILRSRIEQASWEYSLARKRYEKAEAEYVTSKLELHKKCDIKEQLTEHLCTIIQQNELRKAKKLEELMMQLELEADEERLELEIEVERLLNEQDAKSKSIVETNEQVHSEETKKDTLTGEQVIVATDSSQGEGNINGKSEQNTQSLKSNVQLQEQIIVG